MLPTLYVQLVVFLFVVCLQVDDAFRAGSYYQRSNRCTRVGQDQRLVTQQPSTRTTSERPKEPYREEDEDEATLVLRADYVGKSEPAPMPSSKAMLDFFRDPVNRNCLISGGNMRETQTMTTTDELFQIWKHRAHSLGVTAPEMSDDIVRVRIGGMKFPGITLTSTSLIGTKLVEPTKSNVSPSYEFVLIHDNREATGLKPFVWMYNQLTGVGKPEREKDTTPMSLSRVTIQQRPNNTVVFHIETFLEIRVNSPRILLKILPVSKEKAENQGSRSLSKMIQRDIDNAITKFRDIYVASLPST